MKETELIAGDQIRFSSVAAHVLATSRAGDADDGARADEHEERTSGSMLALLEDSLHQLLARWAAGEQPAQLVLVDWLVSQRAMTGAAVLDSVGGEVGVLAAEGRLAEILADPRCSDLARGSGTAAVAPEGIHLTLAGRDALALRAHGTPWLLVVPGRLMPDGAELALLVRLLAVARRLDSVPSAPSRV